MTASIPTLGERLRWAGEGHGNGREAAERAGMARAGFYLLAVGGVLALVSLALPTDEARNVTAIFATATIALALSLVPLVSFDRLPVVAFELLASAGTLLVSSALWFGGTDGYELFYFWVALYAAYFLRPRKVVSQLAFMVSCYGLVEFAGPGQGVSPVHWLVAAGTLSVAAGLVMLLKANLVGSIERLEALIEASPLASIELDPDGRVRGWNGAAEALLGWRFDEVVGRRLPVETGQEHELLVDMVKSGPTYVDQRADLHPTERRDLRRGAPHGAGRQRQRHRWRAHRPPGRRDGPQGARHAARAREQDGVDRPPGRRDRPRLQQFAAGHAQPRRACCASVSAASSPPSSTRSSARRTTPAALVRQLLAFSRNRDVEPTIRRRRRRPRARGVDAPAC